jgi:hypothetical protein
MKPATAKPTVVEPSEETAINAVAAESSFSELTSGKMLACAESKNWVMALVNATITYNQLILNGIRKGMRKIRTREAGLRSG